MCGISRNSLVGTFLCMHSYWLAFAWMEWNDLAAWELIEQKHTFQSPTGRMRLLIGCASISVLYPISHCRLFMYVPLK